MEAPEIPATRDRPWPSSLREGQAGFDREVAHRTVRVATMLAAAAAAVFGVLYAMGGPSEFVIPNAVASIAMLAIALVPSLSPWSRIAGTVTVGMALMASQLFMTGDINSGVTVWLLIPPLGAMLVGARRAAAWGAVVAVVVVVTVGLAGELGWPIVGSVVLPRPSLVMAASIIACLILMRTMAGISLGARHQLILELETRNEELAEALGEAESARAVAIEASRAKDRFFANLTHEIRTPLNGIAGTAELLHQAGLPPEEHAMAEALLVSTRNLATLVNTMLAHARLRAGHVGIDRAPVDLRALAGDLEALFRAQAADKGLRLTVTVAESVAPWIETDGVKVHQILGNLIGNAVKFTDHGGVDVAFEMRAVTPEERLIVTVTDTGIGFGPELAGSIFEPFVQGDPSMTRAQGGTGLGLAIADQLAGVLDGSLTVASRPGEGSTFTLDVPATPTPAPDITGSPGIAEAAPRPSVRVLLAEDNVINRAVASRMLQKLGAEVVVADDGARAVMLAGAGGIDVILMDLQMPGMDGIEAAREIRRRERESGTTGVPIVAMTGNAPEDYGDACAAAGMDGFLTKPVELAQLRAVLDRVPAP